MRFYQSKKLSSFVAVPDGSDARLRGFNEISLEEYNELTNSALTQDVKLPEVIEEEVELEVESNQGFEVDILTSLLGSAAVEETPDEEAKLSVVLNDSIMKQEEKALANSFESIRLLRDLADPAMTATVTKGKSHGVYSFVNSEWKRTGDL